MSSNPYESLPAGNPYKGLVFGLIVYFNQQVTQALEMGKQGMSRQEILARFPTFVQQMPSHPRNPYGQKM